MMYQQTFDKSYKNLQGDRTLHAVLANTRLAIHKLTGELVFLYVTQLYVWKNMNKVD